MGHYNAANDNQIVQEVPGVIGSAFSSPAYFNHQIYYQGDGDVMKAFAITNAVLTAAPVSQSSTSFGYHGSTPVISANGLNNGIAWVIQADAYANSGPAVLHAYNATNLAQELYNSSQNLTRDNPGGAVKFTVPTVINGKVYVGAEYQLSVFGLGTFVTMPAIAPSSGIYTNSVTVTLSDTTPGAVIYYTLDGSAPTTNSTLYAGSFVLTNSATVQAIATAPGFLNSGSVSAGFINSSAVGSGTGLQGAYYTNHTSASPYTGSPTLVRTDAVVNFNWDSAGPDPSIGQTVYTVRWTGSVQPQFDETYTFYATADDGVRLWVNGQELVNQWQDEGATTYQGSIALKAQQLYNIEMDYYQNGGGAIAELQWSSPSTAQAVIPQTQLYPYTNPPPTIILSSPTNGSTYTAAASVTIGAMADAPYNPVGQVAFYAGGSLLGTLSNSPDAPLYTLTTAGLSAGSYTLTAVATDGSGLSSTSAPVNITVNAGSGLPYGLTNNGTVTAFLNMPTVVPATFPGNLPLLLSGTGAFSNTTNRTPAGGLIPYTPNTPLWSDAAVKSRYMALPSNGGLITPDEQISFLPTNTWTFPAGTVFIKNFDLVVNETNASVPLRRLETRLLVRNINGGVYGVTYKWRPDNSDADLLITSSNEDVFITNSTGIRTQTWYYPSPADCLTCHTPVANYVLGVNTRQLNGNQTYPATGNTDNQLRTLNRLGLFYPAINEAAITNYLKLSSLTNLSASLENRSRSYLEANCVQCHQPGGAGITFDARYDTPLAQQNITNYPASVTLGIDNACIVKAQDVWRSTLLVRMNTTNKTIQMPPLARNLIDTNAVQVFTDWINSLPGTPALAPPAITPDGGTFLPSVSVTLQSTNASALLYYTLDGSLPTANSSLYSAPFVLTGNATVRVSAFETNFNNSVAASAAFLVQPLHFTSSGFLVNGQFQLGFAGMVSSNYILQATTNLINWTPISTNMATTNLFNLIDPAATNFPHRFYRVIQQ
jgi:PA14 domain-containing protein/chitobiase/beta-hexosaminidase-like protein/Big-like domain-containing protein